MTASRTRRDGFSHRQVGFADGDRWWSWGGCAQTAAVSGSSVVGQRQAVLIRDDIGDLSIVIDGDVARFGRRNRAKRESDLCAALAEGAGCGANTRIGRDNGYVGSSGQEAQASGQGIGDA